MEKLAALLIMTLPKLSMTQITSGTVIIKDMAGKCLDVNNEWTADRTKVQVWDCSGGANQKWEIVDGQLIDTNSNKCLDINGGDTSDSTPVQIYECNGGANQKWEIVQDGDYFRIKNPSSKKCLDVRGDVHDDGTQVQLYSCRSDDDPYAHAQKWTLDSQCSVYSGAMTGLQNAIGGDKCANMIWVRLQNDTGALLQGTMHSFVSTDSPDTVRYQGTIMNGGNPQYYYMYFSSPWGKWIISGVKWDMSNQRAVALGGQNSDGCPTDSSTWQLHNWIGQWVDAQGGVSVYQSVPAPLPYYPPLTNTCINKDSDLPNLAGVMTLSQAAKVCSQYQDGATQCAGFWYNSKVEGCYFHVHFNSKFDVVPANSGKCASSLTKSSAILHASDMDTPVAVQKVFHFAGNAKAKEDISQSTVSYQAAARTCISKDSCKSYTWPCGGSKCDCPASNPACAAKFPSSANYGFSTLTGDDAQGQAGWSIFSKAPIVPNPNGKVKTQKAPKPNSDAKIKKASKADSASKLDGEVPAQEVSKAVSEVLV